MMRRGFGGGLTWQRWIVISPDVLDAPAAARRYLLAHEWGHVRRGHAAVLVAVAGVASVLVAAAVLSRFAPKSALLVAIAFAAMAFILVAAFWVLHEDREFEADVEAARWKGASAALEGFDWMTGFVGPRNRASRARRRVCLERLAAEETSHPPQARAV